MLLENGKDVFCEKPMATKLSEAKSMVQIAEKASKILMVGFNRRFMPICVRAKELFSPKSLDVCKITFNGFKPRPRALLSNPHPVDLMRFFCGKVSSVRCLTKRDSSANEQSITAFVEFDTGSAGVLIFNNQAGGYSENVELHGGGYSVIVDMVAQEARILEANNPGLFNPQEWIQHKPSKWVGFHGGNGFLQQDQHFLECVRARKKPTPDGADAYLSHELTNIIYRESGLPTFD
jgi:virulence factor